MNSKSVIFVGEEVGITWGVVVIVGGGGILIGADLGGEGDSFPMLPIPSKKFWKLSDICCSNWLPSITLLESFLERGGDTGLSICSTKVSPRCMVQQTQKDKQNRTQVMPLLLHSITTINPVSLSSKEAITRLGVVSSAFVFPLQPSAQATDSHLLYIEVVFHTQGGLLGPVLDCS